MRRKVWSAGLIGLAVAIAGVAAFAQQTSNAPPVWRQHKIIPATNELCQASCDTDEVCQSWSRHQNDCRNYAAPLTEKPSPDANAWGQRSTPYPSAESLEARRASYAADKAPQTNTVIHGFDIAGYTIAKGQRAPDCAAICLQDKACKAWSFIEPTKTAPPSCWTKFAVGPRVPYDRYTTGLRDYTPPTIQEIAASQARRLRAGYEVIELHRPRITARTLSSAERKEAADLAKAYSAQPTWATLERLAVLAQSGDKDVMHLYLQKIGNGYAPPVDAPLENSENVNVFATLSILWGATYWQMHGPDRQAAIAMYTAFGGPQNGLAPRPCAGRWDCGVTVTFAPPKDMKKAQSIFDYAETGKNPPSAAFAFHAAIPRTQTEAARFDSLLAQLNSLRPIWPQDSAFLAAYGAKNGRLNDVAQAEQRFKQGIAEDRAFQRNLRAKDMEATWKRLTPTGTVHANMSTSDLAALEALAAYFGGERLEQVAAATKMTNRRAVEKLCEQGSARCATQRKNLEEAELAARARASQAAVRSGTGLVTQPSASVQVRTYDNNGNYQGTTTMSGWEAEILGAKPY